MAGIKGIRPALMQKRLILFIIFFLGLLISLHAGGFGEAVVGGLTMVGAALAAPFTGGASLALLPAGAAMVADGIGQAAEDQAEEQARITEEQMQYLDAYNEAFSSYTEAQSLESSISSNIDQTEISIAQTEANISAFDQTLVRWQSQYDQQRQALQMQGEADYQVFMQNWQGAELANAARGQTGGSAALVAESQRAQVERYAGSDMRLDQNGGLYGTALSEFRLDMLAGRTELVSNLNVSRQALASYRSTLADYKSQLKTAQENVLNAENAMNAARSLALEKGVDERFLGGSK